MAYQGRIFGRGAGGHGTLSGEAKNAGTPPISLAPLSRSKGGEGKGEGARMLDAGSGLIWMAESPGNREPGTGNGEPGTSL